MASVETGSQSGSIAELIRDEQAEFADLLRSIPSEAWAQPSLCEGWTVRDVVVHAAAHIHNQQRDKATLDEFSRRPNAELIAWLDSPPQESKSRFGWVRRLSGEVQRGELMIHQQDVRRALDIPRSIPVERVRAVVDFGLTSLGGLGLAYARQRSKGLHLMSPEAGWTWGSGPELRGPLEAILMATAGRRSALGDLHGAGVTTLAERIDKPSFLVKKSMAISSSATAANSNRR
jgi:uncharacterized protein (TIGR03083 family)